MKCVAKDDLVRRVTTDTAKNLVENHGWKYVTKKVWKDTVRDKKQHGQPQS